MNLSKSLTQYERLSREEYFLSLAIIVSLRSTCVRRRVGAILTNRKNQIISTGYNGVAAGSIHCIDSPCEAHSFPSGQGLDQCDAIHAEINAIAHCLNPHEINRAYVTVSPCSHCIKALLATPCQEIVFLEEYPHSNSKILWEKNGRKWTQFKI